MSLKIWPNRATQTVKQVNLPLIAAGVIILTLHWQDTEPCDADHRHKWRRWALLSVVRMILITPVVMVSLVEYGGSPIAGVSFQRNYATEVPEYGGYCRVGGKPWHRVGAGEQPHSTLPQCAMSAVLHQMYVEHIMSRTPRELPSSPPPRAPTFTACLTFLGRAKPE